MRLRELLSFNDIVVLCHDNPDADAIASGYALYRFYEQNNKKVRLVYGGKNKIQKSNLVLMVEKLEIPIEYITALEEPDLLITVDCQYGQSNVSCFNGKTIAVIDHHQISGELPPLSEVRSSLGACSTLLCDMLKAEGFDINTDEKLSTALYYGLLTDTNNFAELSHPLDKDLRDDVKYDKILINLFRHSNLSLTELEIAGDALRGYKFLENYRFALLKSKPCDPNILGMISDLALEVDSVDSCVVYSLLPFGVKFSVRSCIREVNAGELAEFIAEGIGGGGGHIGKAGGFLQKDLIKDWDNVEEFLYDRMTSYFEGVEIIYAAEYEADLSDVKEYTKKNIPLGFVKGTDVVKENTEVTIRTLECDMDIAITDDIVIMIGIKGEVYPCKMEKFNRSYEVLQDEYVFEGEYEPVIKDRLSGSNISLIPHAKACIPTGKVGILAKPIDHRVKVFTAWDKERYMRGKIGDYLAIRKDDYHDVYIIEQDIFSKTYE